MISARESVMIVIAFLLFIVVFIIIATFVNEFRERRWIKNLSKLSEEQGFSGDSDIATLCAFRVHIRQKIKECEDTADDFRRLLKETDEAIKTAERMIEYGGKQ